MAVPICGTVGVDGKIIVKLAWTPASGAVSETVRLCIPTAGCQDYANVASPLIVYGLAPNNITYAWSVVSRLADNTTVESVQSSFQTPISGVPPYAPSNLVTTPTEPKVGQPIKFTWTKAGPLERLQYEQFAFGRIAKPGGVIALDSIEDTRQIPADQPPQVDKDDADPGNYGWYIKGIISGGIELDSPIQTLSVLPPPQPAGEVMPITLWHAINYWASYYRLQNSPYVDTIGEELSGVDTMAALSGAESPVSIDHEQKRWWLNPCPKNASGAVGPYQLLGWLPDSLACTAWVSTEKAAYLLFERGIIYPPGGWAVWPNEAKAFYNNYMAGRQWDGYSLKVHRVSTSLCFSLYVTQPCLQPTVDLTNSVGALSHDNGDGTYEVKFRIYNQSKDIPAVFTVISLGPDFTDHYEVIPSNVLWLYDWSGRVILSPAIEVIGPNQIWEMPIRIRPKIPGDLPNFGYRVYGENVGVGSMSTDGSMGIYENAVPMALIPSTVSASTGQRLNADITFDHQGPAVILTADITVTGSGLVKKATLRIPVSNDPTPRRYIATAYLGKVTDVDPRGEWQIKASVSYRGKELISKILAEAYLVS
jgi:hypothetical protein